MIHAPGLRSSRPLLIASAAAGLLSLCLLATASAGVPGKFGAWVAYSHCMRTHGVVSFPDPEQVAGGGIEIPGSQSGGLSPGSPLLLAALRSCRRLLPGGGPTQAGRQRELARMLGVARCMRGHRIQGFPDPTLAPPADRGGYSAIMSNDGVWLAIPGSIDMRSPAFDQAAAACGLSLS